MRTEYNILIGGEAGQGLVTIGQMLGKAMVRQGYHLHVTQSYESRVRGGHNTYTLRLGSTPCIAHRESVDILVALDERTLALHTEELLAGGLILADATFTIGDTPMQEGIRHLGIPLADLARPLMHNTVMFGALGFLLGVPEDALASIIRQTFADKADAIIGQNQDAIKAGLGWMREHAPTIEALPAPPRTPGSAAMLTAHETLALGALSAGLKFCAFYPMSPATSISQLIAETAPAMDIVVEQAEDEIAAVNMAIGAAYAGANALVATSGGGFALMQEGVSLAGMTETPIVLVVAMRPGPATGLPTRTEQADLDFVRYAGHGEFPRAILAPGTPEQSFALARHAFTLTNRYQTPVFILTDQYLADSYRDCERLTIQPAAKINHSPQKHGYQRYAISDDGISPRALPGFGPGLVVADSDEHTPDGHLTEDLTMRVRMHEKRLKKHTGLLAETIPPDFYGPQAPDVLLVCFGSTLGAACEAAERAQSGSQVGVCHFTQVWPLKPQDFIPRFEQAKAVVMVEGNATAQLAGLIRRETGYCIDRHILRYDGLPITPAYILEHLETMSTGAPTRPEA